MGALYINYTFFYRQLDFSSEPGVANQISENEPKSCRGVNHSKKSRTSKQKIWKKSEKNQKIWKNLKSENSKN